LVRSRPVGGSVFDSHHEWPKRKCNEEPARHCRAIEIAESHGMQNVELIAPCCNGTGARFYIALAMLEKETGSCRNVYGHAAGGALSGFPKPVTRDNYEVFKWLVFTKGQRSNGVGPSQLTFKGFSTTWS
jgi:hypothetical protein